MAAIPSYLQVPQVKAGSGSTQKPFNIGNAVGNLLGFDPTPGYNLTWKGPVNNAKPAAKKASVPGQNKQLQTAANLSSSYVGGGGSYQDSQAAQIASQQKSLLDQLGARLGSVYSSSTDAARNAGRNFDTTIRQYGLQTRQAQDAINQKGIQNEASKRAGTQDILSMVGRGIRSGGVMLGNKNAANSSAAERIAQAYGDIGQREQSKVNNQYALANEEIGSEQKSLQEQEDLYRNSTYQNSKEQVIGGIVSSAQSQLAELDNALRGASLPDRISIENEKAKVRSLAQNELAKYDTLLQQELASAHRNTADENRAKAAQLAQLGQAPANQFEYSTEAPAQFQGQAPAGGNLPLFSLKRGQDDQVA